MFYESMSAVTFAEYTAMRSPGRIELIDPTSLYTNYLDTSL